MLPIEQAYHLFKDPKKFHKLFWPDGVLTEYQGRILQSLQRNFVTVVPAGNKLGKDYVAAVAALWFFCSRKPARVVTSSVDGSQLEGVLWGEIRRLIQEARYDLPVQVNHLKLRQKNPDGSLVGNAEMIGRVVDRGEGLLGRHLPYGPNMDPRTFCIVDEASGFDNKNFEPVDTWAHRILIIGNTFPCENFFRRYCENGDQKSESPFLDYDVKIIRVRGEESPNVQLAFAEEKLKKPISHRIIVPGCLTIDEYRLRRKTYDAAKAAASLDAEWYEGEEIKMFPPEWLKRSQELEPKREGSCYLGIDTAEGGDDTVWTVVDKYGIITQDTRKTRNTALIKGITLGLMKTYDIDPDNVLFDRGGGGKEHADYLRASGYDVRTVGFGEIPHSADEFEFGMRQPEERSELKEERYMFKNVRVQMYWILRNQFNPDFPSGGYFHVPERYTELIRQLKVLPILYNEEGRMYLPPKDKPTETYKGQTIRQMLGDRSPDQADSLALAIFAREHKPTIHQIGAF